MTPQEFIKRFPHACVPGKSEILQYTTMAEWWASTERPDWLIWACREMGVRETDLYAWAEVTRVIACDLLDAAKIKHGLRAVEPIVNANTACTAHDAALAAAHADACTAYDAACTAYATEAAYAARAAACTAHAASYDAAYDAACAAYAVAYAKAASAAGKKFSVYVRSLIACPFDTPAEMEYDTEREDAYASLAMMQVNRRINGDEMSDTTDWTRCQYGAFYKEIGPYRFRLHRNGGKGWWVGIEYIDALKADTLTEAKELAHLIARGMGVVE